jgi:predicted nucleotidyltransferase
MNRPGNPNLQILALAIDQLGDLADEMVLLGGCATGLLISDPAASTIRATKDVDTIVDVSSRADYYQLVEKLKQRHFKEDTSDGAPVCRWLGDGVILDVMPVDDAILGFGGAWHKKAMMHAAIVEIDESRHIRMVSPPYFLITKLEAFKGRGEGDYLQSHDIEDIVSVLDGRPEILDEVISADTELKTELSRRFRKMFNDQRFVNALAGHMPPDAASQARVQSVTEIIRKLSEL